MITLDRLRNTIKDFKPAGEDISQLHFDKIATCFEQEKIGEARDMIEKTFTQGNLDIQLIIYYLYAHFLENGVKSFKDSFPTIASLVNDHWEILRPLNRKEKQVQSSLNWLISNILTKLKYGEKLYNEGKSSPIWEKSVLKLSDKELHELIKISGDFREFFYDKWPKSTIKEKVMHLVKKIEELKHLVIKEEEEEKKEETENDVLVADEVKEEHQEITDQPQVIEIPIEEEVIEKIVEINAQEQEEIIVKEEKEQVPIQKTRDEDQLLSFEKMQIFLKKLEVFEILIKKKEFDKAVLVSKDVTYLIEHFDPAEYFPKLFSNYFALLARHIAILSEQAEVQDSLKWKYLDKLYKTDMDKFIQW